MHLNDNRQADQNTLAFVAGGGEMGALIRAFDWSNNPLGPLADWPQSLKTAVSICLDSRFPIPLWWGPDLRLIYNDAWRPVLGRTKHPQALGSPGRDVWPEIWHIIGPMLEGVLATGQATWSDDQLLPLDRNGYLEEAYFTYSYSPIRDESGRVGGVFSAVNETTVRVVGERRLRTLKELAAQASTAKSPEEAGLAALQTLAANPADVPFALLYFLDSDRKYARLCGCTPMPTDTPASPKVIDLAPGEADEAGWRLADVVRAGQSRVVDSLSARFGPMPRGPLPVDPQQAVVLPLRSAAQGRVAGVLVLGVNPCRALDDEHRSFFDLVVGHVAAAVANASAYEEERRRVEALAELDRAKTAFFSNVSHEFRTPLTLMLGPVEDLLARSHTDLPPAAAGQLEVVNRNGLRLLRLVNSLLDFSRIEAGRVRAVYQPTHLATFTADLASVFRSACERAGLRLVVDCPPLAEPVYVDREMWEKIVLNLLSNAFKFTFEGEIAVSVRQVDHAAELRVRDTGTGIPAEEMPRLFERFHRIENARGRTHEGSGIGLALVQELVKLHGGSVTAESVIGKGTTFTVTVPLGSAHLPPDQIGEGRTAASTGTGATPYVEEALRWLPEEGRAEDGGRSELPTYHEALPTPHRRSETNGEDDRPRVLVADDNADMRQYVARLLDEQFRVEAVPDGEAALAAARDRPPDLILTDVMMPKLNGFGLLKELRADPRTSGLPVIMLSARAGEESRVEGMEVGADDYLVKPFSARELLARVTAHLQMARLRRESEQAVRDSENRLRLALTAARMVAWHWNPVEDQVVVSDNAADVFGLPPGSALESSVQGSALVHHDDVERHRATVLRAVEECGGYVSRFRMIRPDNGEIIWMEERGQAACEGPGQAVRVVGVVMDITARKRAEDELQQERDRLKVTLASIGDGVITTDTGGHITFLNGVAESLTGWANADAVGQPLDAVFDIVNEETRQPVENPATRALREGVVVGLANHTVLIRKDGTERPIDDSAAPVRDGEGHVVGCVLVFRDITERRAAEDERRQSEERFRRMADAVPVLIWVSDVTKACTWFNTMWRDFTGRPMHELVGDGWASDVHPDDLGRCLHIYTTNFDARQPFTMEYRLRRHDGEYRWVADHGIPHFDEAGVFAGYVGSCVDFTDRKRAEDELRRLAAELSEADRKKDEFLATLAHELRNPLAPLRNALQIIRLSPDRKAREQSRSMMERQLGQMVRLVDDLMDVSRISRGKVELRKERVQLSAVVDGAVETSRPLIEEMGHKLTVTLPKQPVVVDADPTRLAQVLMNLLTNAAKYSDRGSRITLTAERQGSDVVVAVRDTGIGIPADKLTSIFEMFSQVDRSLEKAQGGLGIGLTLVRRLVEMHGGMVEARSDGPGRGSEFVVRLPVVIEAFVPRQGDAHDEPSAPRSSLRILIVDDNRDGADSLAMMLRLMGNDTATAYDGREGVAQAERLKPDVVLLDIGLPKLNGYEACRRIREQPWGRNAILIAVTGWGQDEDRRRSNEAGFDYHMVKPVDPQALMKFLAGLPGATTK